MISQQIWCEIHPGSQIQQVCLNPDCNINPLICIACGEQYHGTHPLVSLIKFRETLQKYMESQKNKSELSQEGQLSYLRMQNNLERASASISKLSQKLIKLSLFMSNIHNTLISLEGIGEEPELVANLLYHLDSNSDILQINKIFSSLFLLLQVVRMPDAQTSKMELTLTPTPLSIFKTQTVVDHRSDFSTQIKAYVDEQEQQFELFIKKMGILVKDNKQFLVVEKSQELKSKIQDAKQIVIKKEDGIQTSDITVLKKIEQWDQGEPFIEVKQVNIKIANYLIFYNTLVCDAILQEPILRGSPSKSKQDEVKFPIRCALCKLVRIRSFVSHYFRFDPTTKFGRLCQFRYEGQDISAHEMCILWSNRTKVDFEQSLVDISTIITSVQFARVQMCKYCGSVGASLKCNELNCNQHFHFHCLREIKLKGLQLDHENKYRFFCEDHAGHKQQKGASKWFITRIRMKHIIQQGGQPAFTKRYQQIDWSQQDVDDEPKVKKQTKIL